MHPKAETLSCSLIQPPVKHLENKIFALGWGFKSIEVEEVEKPNQFLYNNLLPIGLQYSANMEYMVWLLNIFQTSSIFKNIYCPVHLNLNLIFDFELMEN